MFYYFKILKIGPNRNLIIIDCNFTRSICSNIVFFQLISIVLVASNFDDQTRLMTKSFCMRASSEGIGDLILFLLRSFRMFFGMKGFWSGIFCFAAAC